MANIDRRYFLSAQLGVVFSEEEDVAVVLCSEVSSGEMRKSVNVQVQHYKTS